MATRAIDLRIFGEDFPKDKHLMIRYCSELEFKIHMLEYIPDFESIKFIKRISHESIKLKHPKILKEVGNMSVLSPNCKVTIEGQYEMLKALFDSINDYKNGNLKCKERCRYFPGCCQIIATFNFLKNLK